MRPPKHRRKDELYFVYQEGKSEVVFADRLMEAWAWQARNNELPRLTTRCTLATYVPTGETETAVEARAQVLNLDDAQFGAIDKAVGRLPRALNRIVFKEYWSSGPQAAKARTLSLTRAEYRERLAGALWAVYGSLMPDVERWRSLQGGA